MKKTLSLILALIMLVSCMGVPFAAAEDGEETYTQEEVDGAAEAMKYFKVNNLQRGFDGDIDELLESESKKTNANEKINLIGMDVNFLYNSTSPIFWNTLDIYKKDASGNLVLDETGKPITVINKGKIAMNLSSVNVYLKDIFYKTFGGLKLYNLENTISLANVLGKVFYRDFEKLDVNNFKSLYGNETPNAKEFFEAVAVLSKLDVLVQNNWCTRGRTFCEPVVKALGGGYCDISSEHYTNGKMLAAKTLEAVFTKMNIEGPVKTIADALKVFMASYDVLYRDPILALFTHKMEKIQNAETVEFYNSFDGLLEIIFCDCDPTAEDAKSGCFSSDASVRASVNHFCPLDVPVERLLSASDDDDFYLYIYYYLNLCGAHRGNTAYINRVKSYITNCRFFNGEHKAKIKSIVDGYLLNNIESTSEVLINPYLSTLFDNGTSTVNGVLDRLKNSLLVLLKKIADYFDYLRKIFTGELEYGQGNSPFM